MAEKDVLSNMFSSFVSRKTRTFSPQATTSLSPHAMSLSPPLPLPLLPQMTRLSNPPIHLPANSHPQDGSMPIAQQHNQCGLNIIHQNQDRYDPPVTSQDPVDQTTVPCRTRPRDDGRERDEARATPNAKSARHSRSKSSQSASKTSSSRASGSHSRHKSHSPDKKGTAHHTNTGGASSSVHGGRGSAGSVEAIATDSTAVATPFHCDKCSKAFRQRSQLSRHFLRVHERKKPFSCAHCEKCFASAFDRKRHVEAVHGRRCIEFFCDRCSFRSKHDAQLEEHIRTMHERDQCRLCGKIFKRAANRVAHERHYHSKPN